MERINFSPLDFSSIPQRQAAARKNWYDSLSGMASGLGREIQSGAKEVGSAWQRELDRRNASEWQNKQWQNTLDRQRIADERYNDELQRRMAEQRRLEGEKQRRNAAAYKLRSEFMKRHSYDDIGKYGPGAEFAYGQMVHGTDWNDITTGGNMLNNIIAQQQMIEAQQQMIEAQRQEQANARVAPNASNQMASELSLMNIDLNDPEASALRYSPDYYAAEDKLYNLNRRIQRTEDLINAGYGSEALYRQRAAMQRAAAALRRKMGTASPSGAFPHKKEL